MHDIRKISRLCASIVVWQHLSSVENWKKKREKNDCVVFLLEGFFWSVKQLPKCGDHIMLDYSHPQAYTCITTCLCLYPLPADSQCLPSDDDLPGDATVPFILIIVLVGLKIFSVHHHHHHLPPPIPLTRCLPTVKTYPITSPQGALDRWSLNAFLLRWSIWNICPQRRGVSFCPCWTEMSSCDLTSRAEWSKLRGGSDPGKTFDYLTVFFFFSISFQFHGY